MSKPMNLCELPHDILERVLKLIHDLNPQSAKDFITCNKQLWHSDILSVHVSRLEVDLDGREGHASSSFALRHRIMAFPSQGRAVLRTLIIRGVPDEKKDAEPIFAAVLSHKDVVHKLAHLHALIVPDMDILRLVPSLPWLASMLQRPCNGLRELRELHVKASRIFSLPSPDIIRTPYDSHLTTLKLQLVAMMSPSGVVEAPDPRAIPIMFPRLEVLELDSESCRIPDDFYDFLETYTPSLRVLKLTAHGLYGTKKTVASTTTVYRLLSGRLPNLGHLELPFVSKCPAPEGTPPPHPEASQLRSLHIRNLSYGAIVHLLPLLPRVPHLTHVTVERMDLHVTRKTEIRANIHYLGRWASGAERKPPLYLEVRGDEPTDKDVQHVDELFEGLLADEETLASDFMTMLEPLQGSTFAESITAIGWESYVTVPGVIRACARVFPNIVDLLSDWSYANATSDMVQRTFESLTAWPQLRSICFKSHDEHDDLISFVPVLAFALGRGKKLRVAIRVANNDTFEAVRADWDRFVSMIEHTTGHATGVDLVLL